MKLFTRKTQTKLYIALTAIFLTIMTIGFFMAQYVHMETWFWIAGFGLFGSVFSIAALAVPEGKQ